MGKVYTQHTGSAWDFSGSISKSSSANSGSFLTRGYNRLVGAIYISGSLTSGSGLHIWQSIDDGTNWDVVHNYAPSTVGTSSYDIEVVGERMFISTSPGEDDITAFRALFYLQPIGLGTVGLKVGSIDIGNVIVDEISKIQQRVSASISSGSITILSPAGSDFHAVLETSTSVIGSIAGVNARVSASLSSGSVTVLSSAGSDLHAILETSTSVIGAISSVQGQVSASVSGGSVAMLAGANDVGIVHVGTGTCSMGSVTSVEGRISASLASGSVTVLSPAGSDLHAILETSSSVIGVISGINSRISASLASGSVTALQTAGSDLHAVLETSTSVIGSIAGVNARISASIASGSITTLSPAGSDLHVVLETSTSTIGKVSDILNQVSASVSGGSVTMLAGENHIGEVGGKTVVVSACVTRPADASPYAIGDMWADATTNGTLLRFPNCARKNNGSGIISHVLCIDSASQATMPTLNLWIFDNTVTSPSDNAPFPLTDAEIEKTIGVVEITTWFAGGSTLNGLSQVRNLNVPFVCQSACNSLWGVPILTNAYTPTSGENLEWRLGILDD